MIIARWGTPVDTKATDTVSSNATLRDNKAYQGQMTLSSSPRELTPHEAGAVLSETMRQWALTHPEAEVKYVEIEQSSPQVLRFQFVAHTQVVAGQLSAFAFTIAAVAAFLGALLAWIAAHALTIIITFAVAAVCLMLIRLPDYFFPPTTYECPYCGQQFSTYEAMAAHIQSEHPGKVIPERPPTGVGTMLGWVVVGAAALAAVALVYRFVVKPMLKKPEEKHKRQVK